MCVSQSVKMTLSLINSKLSTNNEKSNLFVKIYTKSNWLLSIIRHNLLNFSNVLL
jgi:hypothetical protein